MTEDNNKGKPGSEQQAIFDTDALTEDSQHPPHPEPEFTRFDDEDEYEEPDRDTDYASSYAEDDIDDYPEAALDDEAEPSRELDEGNPQQAHFPQDPITNTAPWQSTLGPADEDTPERPGKKEGGPESDENRNQFSAEYLGEWEDEDDGEEHEQEGLSWPLGLIAIAALAIILLAAGGYGVIQQRAATQEEIRTLRASLATAASPTEITASNNALREAKQRNVELSVNIESLQLENRRLVDTVAGLEAQLEVQQNALAEPIPPPKETTRKPAPASVTAPAQASSGGDTWFVNFGSYSQRGLAESWATKLKPAAGRSTVTTASKDGKTFYRVRIIALASRKSAEQVARQLESQYGLPTLWIGK